MVVPFIVMAFLSGAAVTLLLRKRMIQPEEIIGSHISGECLDHILTMENRRQPS